MPIDGGRAEPPRLAARRWDEFSGKQTLLSSFFAKGGKMTAASTASDTTHDSQPPGSASPCSSQAPAILSIDAALLVSEAVPPVLAPVQDPDSTSESLPFLTTTTGAISLLPTPTPSPSESRGDPETKRVPPLKRRSTDPPTAAVASSKPSKKQKRDKGKHPGSGVGSGSGQRTLAAFFAPQPSQSQPPTQPPSQSKSQRHRPSASQTEWNASRDEPLLSSDDDLATDYQLALRLASSQEAEPLSLISSTGNGSCSNSKAAWSQLMAPIQAPKCTVHGEPAKEYTVNKPGPNKGKTFFICSRYVIVIHLLGDLVTSLTDAQSDLFPDLIFSGPVTQMMANTYVDPLALVMTRAKGSGLARRWTTNIAATFSCGLPMLDVRLSRKMRGHCWLADHDVYMIAPSSLVIASGPAPRTPYPCIRVT